MSEPTAPKSRPVDDGSQTSEGTSPRSEATDDSAEDADDVGVFDLETVLDISVNIIPVGILLFFIVLYLAVNPFGYDPWVLAVSHGLMLVPIASLAILTYFAAEALTRDRRERDVEG